MAGAARAVVAAELLLEEELAPAPKALALRRSAERELRGVRDAAEDPHRVLVQQLGARDGRLLLHVRSTTQGNQARGEQRDTGRSSHRKLPQTARNEGVRKCDSRLRRVQSVTCSEIPRAGAYGYQRGVITRVFADAERSGGGPDVSPKTERRTIDAIANGSRRRGSGPGASAPPPGARRRSSCARSGARRGTSAPRGARSPGRTRRRRRACRRGGR